MATTMEISVEMTAITCCSAGCGLTFAVPIHWASKRREDHSWWHCPNGHTQHFPAKSSAEKLRDELLLERQKLDQVQADRNRWRAEADVAAKGLEKAKAEAKRAKTRAANGVCPCCSRTFANLCRHMKTKHPDHAK